MNDQANKVTEAPRAAGDNAAPRAAGVRIGPGLSAKLLLLTILFVMLAEVLIFVPSIANFRMTWLRDRLPAAQIAAMVLEAAPDGMIPKSLEQELLDNAGAMAIALSRNGTRQLLMIDTSPPSVDLHVDLRETVVLRAFEQAFATLLAGDGRIINVRGSVISGIHAASSGDQTGDFIEVVMNETPLRQAMIAFSFNILTLSILISVIAAALVYLALNWMLVRPMRRITENMVAFSNNPEDRTRIIQPGTRRDEIGVAERQLAAMQEQLSGTLHQKGHLAALGLAVSKINHDLRNMLSNSHLISDRLASVPDPTVQRFVPKLIASLDRAVALCTNTIKYGQAREQPPSRRRLILRQLVDDAADSLEIYAEHKVQWRNNVPPDLEADADPDQLYRVLLNLVRNAVQALETIAPADGAHGVISVDAQRDGAVVTILVSDNGPGVPAMARERLFEAFQSTARPGGTGLGLAISAELIQAHGGTISLDDTENGTTFRVVLPDAIPTIGDARATQAKRQAGE
jgi:signal transduction histidine kinase